MPTTMNTTQHSSRCLSYPQGEVSLIPQVLTLMALFSTLMAFPAFNFSNDDINFMCLEMGNMDDICFQLKLNSRLYWQTEIYADVHDNGWAVWIKIGTLFGIIAGGLGFIAFALLVSASCFALSSHRLERIMTLQVVCAFCSMMTLIAGGANPCRKVEDLDDNFQGYVDDINDGVYLDSNNTGEGWCYKDRMRMDTGALFMVCASILYLVSAPPTNRYCSYVKNAEKASAAAAKEEKRGLMDADNCTKEKPDSSKANVPSSASVEYDA